LLRRVYQRTGSIWPAVLIHWLVVVVWKTFFGGLMWW
jgi:predicted Abi (CAAX) family protease